MPGSVIENKNISKTVKEFEYKTILFNCNCHTFEAVIEQIMKAIGCDTLTAKRLTNIAHTSGSVIAYKGKKEKCEKVADILGGIGLLVKVES